MDADRSTAPPARRIVWSKRAHETIITTLIVTALGVALVAGAINQLGEGEIAGGCILLIAGLVALVISARIADKEAVSLEVAPGAVTARGLITRRVRARAPLDAASEIVVAAATIVGPIEMSQHYSVIGSKRLVHEFDVRVRADEENEVTVARMKFRKDAEELAQWVEAERARVTGAVR